MVSDTISMFTHGFISSIKYGFQPLCLLYKILWFMKPAPQFIYLYFILYLAGPYSSEFCRKV